MSLSPARPATTLRSLRAAAWRWRRWSGSPGRRPCSTRLALLALDLLLRLGALLLDSADAAIPVCAHGGAPVVPRKAEVVPPVPRRC